MGPVNVIMLLIAILIGLSRRRRLSLIVKLFTSGCVLCNGRYLHNPSTP